MPSTNNRNLTLITEGDNVTIKVQYKATFTPLDRHLASKGLRFRERILVIGEDPGTRGDRLLYTFPMVNLPVTDGSVNLVLNRNLSQTVTRASLQEDTGLGDADEIRCNIQIIPMGIPETHSSYTDQEVLLG